MTDTEKLDMVRFFLRNFANKLGAEAADRYVQAAKATDKDSAAVNFGMFASDLRARINVLDILTQIARDEREEVSLMTEADKNIARLKHELERQGITVAENM